MIVVGMCPAWRIDLAGRDADGAKRCDREGALFAATSDGRAKGVHRRGGTTVAGLVADVLVAPMVHLQHGSIHRLASDAFLQLVVIDDAERVEVLVVDAQGQHKMPPLAARHLSAPRHFTAGFQGYSDVCLPELAGVIDAVGQRHSGIKEVERLLLLLLLAVGTSGDERNKKKESCNEDSLKGYSALILHTYLL